VRSITALERKEVAGKAGLVKKNSARKKRCPKTERPVEAGNGTGGKPGLFSEKS